MWTVRKVRVAIDDNAGARSAARYPLDPGDSPSAFAPAGGEGSEPRPLAYWLGSEGALRQLGLERGQEVEPEQLALALQGRGMDGGQVRRPGPMQQPVRDDNGRPLRSADGKAVTERKLGIASYDLTFSAPKSVSVVWSQAGEELRRKIETAMLEAWNAATEHLIRSHDVVMQGRDENGERLYGPAEGFAAAASLQVTARRAQGDPAPAPQLHVHGMLVGLERLDGILAGINSRAIFGDAALEAGAYARALLAERLSEIGLEIESGTGRDGLYFEIRGVPKGLIEAMSGRTREIEEAAAREELDLEKELTNGQRAELAMLTRMAKEGAASPEQIAAWWRARAEEFELGPRALTDLVGEPGFGLDPEEAQRSLAAAVEKCMRKRGPTVSRAAARGIVMAAAPGRMTVAEAEEMIESLQARGSLLALEQGRVTTPSIRTEELEVVAALRHLAERPREALSAEAIAAGERYATASLNGGELSPEQREKIAELSGGAGWSILTGRAGTGKTPVLQAIAGGHRHEGWDVVACAIDWSTAQELAEDVGAQALSIRQVLKRAADGRLAVGKRTLILIEEAGKVGLPQWRQLADLVDRTGAHVLAVGHAGQIGAVELAGMFEEMVRHPEVVQVSELHEVRRHRHRWMRDVQVAIDEGHGDVAVGLLVKHKAITFYATKAEATEGMVDRWFAAQRQHGGERAAMIVQGSNEDVDEVNALAQQRRLREGEIRGRSVAAQDRDYGFYVGDRVVLRGAAYHFEPDADGGRERQVENGTRGIVRRVDPAGRRMWVEVREPGAKARRVEIDLARPSRAREGGEQFADPSWRLDYAIHPNPAQGRSIFSVDHLGGHWSQDQESSYVGLSRQIAELHDHVICEGFEGETEEEWMQEYARKLSTSRRREASIRFREAPGQQIGAARAAGYELPEEVGRDAEAPRAEGRSLAERFDPLASYRGALGEQRAAWIERQADRYGAVAGRMDSTRLRAERAEARESLEGIDRKGALRTRELQRDRKAVEAEVSRARRHAETLRERAAEMRGRGAREDREAMLEVAAIQEELVAKELERRQAMLGEEAELHREGVHLDDWMRAERDAAARYVAGERGLFARREQSLEDDIEEVLREPPADLVARVGPAPEVDEPEREEWEEVVWELECNRLIAEGELPAAEPSPRQLSELERRIERLRGRRGLGPQLGAAPAPDLDFE